MPYANWSSIAFYNPNDIVVYSGEDYQALLASYNVVPVGNPLVWNPISPPGPGPSNQLAFNQPTTDLSIVGGNTIDISPQLVYSGSSDPATNTLSVGNTNVLVPTVPLLTFNEPLTGLIARPIILTSVDDASVTNPPPYRLVEANVTKNTGENWRFFIDVEASNHVIGSEFTTVGFGGLILQGEPVTIRGNGNQQLRLTDVSNTAAGLLWVRADGSLMWNANVVSGP